MSPPTPSPPDTFPGASPGAVLAAHGRADKRVLIVCVTEMLGRPDISATQTDGPRGAHGLRDGNVGPSRHFCNANGRGVGAQDADRRSGVRRWGNVVGR